MRTTLFCVVLCAAFLSAAAHAKADTILDFDALEEAGSLSNFSGAVTADGFTVDNVDYDAFGELAYHEQSHLSYAGSAGLFNNRAGSTTRLSQDNGHAFSIASIDLALVVNVSAAINASVTFYGYTASGGVIDTTFTVDRPSPSSPLPALSFETFTFVGAGWQSLTHVEWDQSTTTHSGHQFDNIVLGPANPVPEPTTLALFGLGAGALALRRRKRRLA